MVKYDKYERRTIPINMPKNVIECLDKECERRQRSRNFVLNEWIREKCLEIYPDAGL